MTQPPQQGRNRRANRTPKPEDVTPPVRKPTQPQARPPVAASAELRERRLRMQQEMQEMQGMQNPAPARRLPVYSDFDEAPPPSVRGMQPVAPVRSTRTTRTMDGYPAGSARPPRPRREKSHNGLWLAVALICLICTAALGVFVAPQLLGVEFATMPNYAFANGSVIMLDRTAVQNHAAQREAVLNDRICANVFIDGVHVGGMTVDEAIAAVGTAPGNEGSDFAITINVEGYTWSVDSSVIPLYRNTAEVVLKAYAIGRQNTTGIRGTSITPFRERLGAMQNVWQGGFQFYTTTTYDRDAVRAVCDSVGAAINREPVNASVATFDATTKTFTFNSDEAGLFIDTALIYDAVISRLDSGVYYDTLVVYPQILLADVTKAELMNAFGLVSTFTTTTTSNKNRNTNIDLAARAINGRTVLPGETFSFNQATGQRTVEKGYKPAAAIAGGETFDEIGGGVCQTSTTLFNAVVRANMTIIDRDPHAWPSDYVPKGEDATVNWPNLDFRFRNDSDWPIFIVAWYADRKVTVEVYGMTLGDGITIDLESETVYTKNPPSEPLYVQNPDLPFGTEKVTVKARTGYTVETYKVWKQNGVEYKREKLHTSHYKMYQKTIEWN